VAALYIALGRAGEGGYRTALRAELEAAAEEIRAQGGRALALACDVRDEEQVRAAALRTAAELGGIDYVVACAGIFPRFREAWTIPNAEWDATIGVDLTGAWLTCKHAIPHLIARGRGGALVLVSSMAGIRPQAYNLDYVAAKYGVVGLGLGLAIELGPHGIRSNVICPGMIDTPMVDAVAEQNAITREQMLGQYRDFDLLGAGAMRPEDSTTPAILWLLGDEARFVTGQVLAVDAGASIRPLAFGRSG